MKRVYPIKKKLPFSDNVQSILPLIYDDFMSYKDRVVNHPRLKRELHRMRIKGKPLRYAMEYSESAFGEEFSKLLAGVKDITELMGEIHDADVTIPELQLHLKEIRHYNRTLQNRKEHLSTNGIIKLIRELREKRAAMFDNMCRIISHWINEDFRTKLIASMNTHSYNLTLVKPKAI